jgi:hypothetical protein
MSFVEVVATTHELLFYQQAQILGLLGACDQNKGPRGVFNFGATLPVETRHCRRRIMVAVEQFFLFAEPMGARVHRKQGECFLLLLQQAGW